MALGKIPRNELILNRSGLIVGELHKVQNAIGTGYLSAFPFGFFSVKLLNGQDIWAPWYVIHKIMAGLLDQYIFLQSQLALEMVIDEANFFHTWVEGVVAQYGIGHWINMLNVEFGGMEEVLYNLYGVTKDPNHASLAARFVKPSFYDPLVQNTDQLGGIHANTHLAQANGMAAAFEVAQNTSQQHAVANFFRFLTAQHSYATGGSNDHEYWTAPNTIGDALQVTDGL
ncbi:hypothetical protein WJX73_004726 [Symbiochloris irregularis]|uniref:Non-reducing end beta-L-arabinofuranosidase-like GH127 catalytic domain-containing protein n=1 Tax=Symbiochloris irregularis TaxID=706552 RepID=A0AAW1PEE9_9CHLO